jgi:hypothetical protein
VAVTDPPPPVPANDLCANAQTLELPAVGAAALVVSGTTRGASDNLVATTLDCVNVPTGATPPDVFYKFTTTTAVKLTAVTSGTPKPDTVVYLLKDSCTGAELACNDDTGGVTSSITSTLLAATTYVLVVDSYRKGVDFDLTITTATP